MCNASVLNRERLALHLFFCFIKSEQSLVMDIHRSHYESQWSYLSLTIYPFYYQWQNTYLSYTLLICSLYILSYYRHIKSITMMWRRKSRILVVNRVWKVFLRLLCDCFSLKIDSWQIKKRMVEKRGQILGALKKWLGTSPSDYFFFNYYLSKSLETSLQIASVEVWRKKEKNC